MELRSACFSVLLFVVLVGVGSSADSTNSGDEWMDKMTSVATRAIQDCEENQTTSITAGDCLKSKVLRVMDRALKYGPLSFGEGFTLVRLPPPRGARALPSLGGVTQKSNLDDLLAGRAERLLETRALQVPLATLLGMDSKENAFTGRGKLKKMAGPAILIMVMAAYKLAMLMAGIAMLSGKALIVSKVALTLAGVAILKKLLNNGEGHDKTTVEIVKTPQVSHSHHDHHDHRDHRDHHDHHDHDDYGHHDKSWSFPGAGSGYGGSSSGSTHYIHRSLSAEDEMEYPYPSGPAGGPDSSEVIPPMHRRSFKVAAPSTIDTVRISGRTPLRVVLASPPLLHDDEPPMSDDYSQFGDPDTGAWRGLGSTGSVDRSLGGMAGSEYTERAAKGEMTYSANSEYHPRSLWSNQVAAAAA